MARDFGAHNVGMMTGDATINRDAPIICCTAEILSNMALRMGAAAPVDYAIIDEFHYYSDKDRGMAWQVPLLLLQNTTFLLMSATIGDCTPIERSLEAIGPKEVAVVRSSERPVPLDFTYRETPIHETLQDLIRTGKTPIYVVNFTQRECVEEAQNVLSIDFCTKEEKAAITAACQGFRFDSPFGKDMRRFVTHGVGLHHAGLLPKYRLLVEKLAQQGLLKIIMGTDTLGVGVNVPIRAVLFTKLCKYDGEKTGILSVRDFKQISGRAGRKGFDEAGSVLAQAPEHVIENKRMESRAEGNPAKKRKLVKKKPPTKNYVPWDAQTFQRLIDDAPEPLTSQFSITHALILNVLQNDSEKQRGYRKLVTLIARCHDSPVLKSRHRKAAAVLFRSLRQAGIISIVRNRVQGNRVVVNENLQEDFSLNQALALYLLDTLPKLDNTLPNYPLDILTLVESILENPHIILAKQVDVLKTAKMAELKAEGMEFDQRIEELDKIEHPKPNRDFIYDTFNAYSERHPWLSAQNIHPKSIARDMFERCAQFHEYVREYSLQRSEGVLLRYLSQAYKTLIQTVPESYQDERLEEISIFLRTMLGRVDSSLVHAWEDMLAPVDDTDGPVATPRPRVHAFDPKANFRAFSTRIRTEMHRLVKCLATKDYEEAAAAVQQNPDAPWTPERLMAEMQPYYESYEKLWSDPSTRLPHLTRIKQVETNVYEVQQVLCDPEQDHQWMVLGQVHWDPEADADAPWVALDRIGI
jgi:superfamily II RNA helicase